MRSGLYFKVRDNFKFTPKLKVLDLGVSGNDDDYFHKLYPYKKNITAAGLAPKDDYLKKNFPEIKYVHIKPKFPYPFKNKQFEFVHTSAVIEHVGNRKNQLEFLKELNRIGESGVATTPNRWFPLEFHTFMPFIHWLPTDIYRKLFNALGFKYYSSEANLNLLDFNALNNLAAKAGFKRYKIVKNRILGITSNFLLIWYKK